MKYPVKFDLELKDHSHPGKLIAFEGIDASGKTTHSQKLVDRLNEEGLKAIYTKEPTEGPIGQMIRKVLSREIKVTPISLQYLFCADRANHQVEIEELLSKGHIVVTDRYFWSAVAYGISDLGGSPDFYLTAFSVLSFYNRFIRPDFTFYLDINVAEAAQRISKSHKHKEIYDDKNKLSKIDESYKKLIGKFPQEFTVINANGSIDEVGEELLRQVKERLK
jgi:dTMP kinase